MTDGTSAPSPSSLGRRAVVLSAIGLIAVVGLVIMVVLRPWSRPAPAPVRNGGHWEAVQKGRAYLNQNRPDLALQAVSHIRDEGPGAGEAMCVAGLALANMEQFRAAKQALERSLRLQPKQPMAAKVLAAIHLSMGDSGPGLECLRKAADLSPTDFRPWFTMGQVYLDIGETDKAASSYREAIRRNERDVDSRIGLIEALLTLNQAEEAGTVVTETLALDPNRAKLLGLAARQVRDTGRDEEALALADRALAIDPDDIESLFIRAQLNHASGHSDKALGDLERVVTLNPNKLAGLNLLAQVEARLGLGERSAKTVAKHRQASERLAKMDSLTREIAGRPDDPEPRWRLGVVAVEGGQRTLAVNCFQAALALNPDYRPARESLAALNALGAPPTPPSVR